MRSLTIALLGLGLSLFSIGGARAGTCEEDVVADCVATACPTFCATVDKASRDACKTSCTADDRCKLTLFGGQDRTDQAELDIQKRTELMACLAENRDAIAVPDDLGKPILTEDKATDTTTTDTTATGTTTVKRHSLRDHKVSKKNWKKLVSKSFALHRKGKKRVDPLVFDNAATDTKTTTTSRVPDKGGTTSTATPPKDAPPPKKP